MSTSKIQGSQYSGTAQVRPQNENSHSAKVGASAGVKASDSLKSTRAPHSDQASKAAEVEMSEKAKSYQKALNIARSTPDIREEKVAAIKKKIADGTYKIDAGAIADGIAREALLEHLAETEGR